MKDDYIKIYADGRIDVQLSPETIVYGEDNYSTYTKFVANGDASTMTIVGNSYSPTCEKTIDAEDGFERIKNQIARSHYSGFERILNEQERKKN